MVLTIIIAFVSLISLVILHELGHFIFAKRFGVKVEEFGIGYPPRLIGKKFGETIYSLNLLPFGAFVKIQGEIGGMESSSSFSGKPIWQRALILLAGVLSFWLIAAVLLSIVLGLGTPTAISDDEAGTLVDPKVQVIAVAQDSPAQYVGIKEGDAIKEFSVLNIQIPIEKVKDFQDLTSQYKGQEITLKIERGKEILNVSLTPRVSPPDGEGPIGIALTRTAIKSVTWWQAPLEGVKATVNLTIGVIQGYGKALDNIFQGKPSGVQMMGPIGIVSLVGQVSKLGLNYFLQFIAMIAVYIAVFNILPIPAVDGGRLFFLLIEAIRKKPISVNIEQKITAVCFGLLVLLMIFVTIKDLIRIF